MLGVLLGACAFGRPVAQKRPALHARPRRCGALPVAQVAPLELLDEWFRTAPYQSAFCVTALKATASDLLAQKRERLAAETLAAETQDRTSLVSCDDISCEEVSSSTRQGVVWPRTLAFLLYGGGYQGCVQYYLFNECFPVWFGLGQDFWTVAEKVLFDQFVLTPFLCLPVAYLIKAVAFRYGLGEGLQRYLRDARRDLLVKYWLLWGPVQCLTFAVVPQQWRIPFISLVSFFWLIVLSTISSRDDPAPTKRTA